MPPPDSQPAFVNLQRQFCEYLRDPENREAPGTHEDRRLSIYRHAIYANVEGLLKDNYPRVRDVFDDDTWSKLVRHYVIHHVSTASAFVEVPAEFLIYLESGAVIANLPDYIFELAHFDWLETLVGADERDLDFSDIDESGDFLAGVPVVNPLVRLERYRYPVHVIGADYQPDSAPQQATRIAAFRDREHRYGFLDLNPMTARLLELAMSNQSQTGETLFAELAKEFDYDNPLALAQSAHGVVDRMRQRDVILGIRQVTLNESNLRR